MIPNTLYYSNWLHTIRCHDLIYKNVQAKKTAKISEVNTFLSDHSKVSDMFIMLQQCFSYGSMSKDIEEEKNNNHDLKCILICIRN